MLECKDCCLYNTEACRYGRYALEHNTSFYCDDFIVEHNKAYQQGRADAIAEFAKWLEQKGYLSTIEHDEDEDSEGFIVYHEYVNSMRAEDVCEEYFKEQSNG